MTLQELSYIQSAIDCICNRFETCEGCPARLIVPGLSGSTCMLMRTYENLEKEEHG